MITVVTVEMTRRHFVRHHKKGNDFSPLGYISEIGSKLSLFRYDRYVSVPGRRRGGERGSKQNLVKKISDDTYLQFPGKRTYF